MSAHFLVKGYGSVFHIKDAQGDVVVPGAFRETLLRHRLHKTSPFLFIEHDPRPLGRWDIFEEDGHGLWLEGVVWHPPPWFFVKEHWSLSIGFDLLGTTSFMDERQITKVNLFEISLVREPSNPLTALILKRI